MIDTNIVLWHNNMMLTDTSCLKYCEDAYFLIVKGKFCHHNNLLALHARELLFLFSKLCNGLVFIQDVYKF